MSVGTAFHDRTAPLNRKMQWREWAGFYAASVYADFHDIEYNAIREAAALIDVSPLFKYRVSGPDAERLVDRVITRDATKLKIGAVYYTPWCDEHGKVVDDGTVHRLSPTEFRWTAADPQLRWLRMNAAGLHVTVEDVSESLAALALQGPQSRAVLEAATGESFADLGYFRRRGSKIGAVALDVSRTGYTGDLGYELWLPEEAAAEVWDALVAAGTAHGIRPAGMLALDVTRLEAGLILLEVDYTSARQAMNPEQNYSPFEIGLGRLVTFDKADFVGKRALEAERRRGGPGRRLVGLTLDWYGIEGLFAAQGLPPAVSPTVDRSAVPVFAPGRGQVGKATSRGWSPILKQAIALASVPPAYEKAGSQLEVEWTVEGRRGRVRATVVELPFLDLPRKRA
ncbi:MAG: glycine cleavage T protein (aminomethyl transferase), aminomethyltransferase [Chloroflexi bacterium CSP1-4]|nr:MAG: glycine cleavage T protein (aminomethyl transferase), aminomethyltransferase [Chloroflexi bacterium CSP1-4]KRT75688.1 MAG: glycine cleavage T protein (aminomethyl transferase), aminomethyltransferase [Armatimonadetes bacterium CSP1-3]